jgi:hypothetical protein
MLYPKIETLFVRDENTFKVIPGKYKNEVFSLIREWEWTEKIDGTNIRMAYDGLEKDIMYGGRTENASIPPGVLKYLGETVCPVAMDELFDDKKVVIFGEGYGAKIQNGGGYSLTQKFIVFDILVAEKYWLKRADVEDICTKLGLDVVPFKGIMTIQDAAQIVGDGFKSQLGDGSVNAEGLVGRTAFPLFDSKHRRLICKLKTKDFH